MLYTFRELEKKDVVNLSNGKILGHISDLEIDGACGRICMVTVTPIGSFWSSGKEDIMIPWEKIRCMGEDTVIVDIPAEDSFGCENRRKDKGWIW